MAMRDEDFGTDLNLGVGDDGDWSPPEVVEQPSRDFCVGARAGTGGCRRSARGSTFAGRKWISCPGEFTEVAATGAAAS